VVDSARSNDSDCSDALSDIAEGVDAIADSAYSRHGDDIAIIVTRGLIMLTVVIVLKC
jgi:hypothetical protein